MHLVIVCRLYYQDHLLYSHVINHAHSNHWYVNAYRYHMMMRWHPTYDVSCSKVRWMMIRVLIDLYMINGVVIYQHYQLVIVLVCKAYWKVYHGIDQHHATYMACMSWYTDAVHMIHSRYDALSYRSFTLVTLDDVVLGTLTRSDFNVTFICWCDHIDIGWWYNRWC